MRRKRLLCDVDEVLADLHEAIFQILEKVLGLRLTAEDFNVWNLFDTFSPKEQKAIYAEMGKPGFCASLRPKEGAVEAVLKLRRMVDVYVVTSRFKGHGPTWVFERDAWLREYFGFELDQVIHTSAKFLIAGDAILDDRPDNVTSWLAEHPDGLGMLWDLPNTRTLGCDSLRVRNWRDVTEKVQSLVDRR